MRAHVYILQGHLDSLCLMFRMVEHLCSRMTGAAQPLISKQLLAQVAQLMTLFGSWRAATRYADWPVLLLLLPACLQVAAACGCSKKSVKLVSAAQCLQLTGFAPGGTLPECVRHTLQPLPDS
jgi:hypothetical protein